MTKKFCCLCFALISLILTATSQLSAEAVIVGDPKNPAGLAQAVQNAYAAGARRIVIKPGVYFLPNVGHSALTLDGWADATLSAYGATLILTDLAWNHNLFEMVQCRHVTLQGGTLSQNKIASYQGRVVAVGIGADGKATCDWKPDAGYPVPPADAKKFPGAANVVDAHTRLLKVGNGDFYDLPMENMGNGTYRLSFNQKPLRFGVGDWLVGRYGDAPFKVHVVSSHDCTVKDVTMMRNGFANVREEGGGGNHYLHCLWALGPRPSAATENPLVTNSADGMHMTSSNPGPDIENCVFQGVLLDDCIAIHGYFAKIKNASGATLTLDGGPADLQVGQPGRISDEKGFFGEATVLALKDNGDKTWTVTLDKDLSVPASAKISNPLREGAGYKIIGCHLGNTRSRGILAKSDGGLIQNNVISGCGMSAISLGPEYYWGEADYVQNVLVEGNLLRENGGATYGGAAILVHGDGAMGNKNIVIRSNKMFANYQGDMQIEWADGVKISGNLITGAPVWPEGMAAQSPISLANCRAVALQENKVQHPGVYKPHLIAVGANVADVQNNDAAGIRADPLTGPSPGAPSSPRP